MAVSPDGNYVYVGSFIDDALLTYSRNPNTGALTFVEMMEDGHGGVNGLDGPKAVAISPDGMFLYVAANKDDDVSVFGRDAITGHVHWVEFQKDGFNSVDGISNAYGIAISPDGAHVYVTGKSVDHRSPPTARSPCSGATR